MDDKYLNRGKQLSHKFSYHTGSVLHEQFPGFYEELSFEKEGEKLDISNTLSNINKFLLDLNPPVS
jgi:hypothetical protein